MLQHRRQGFRAQRLVRQLIGRFGRLRNRPHLTFRKTHGTLSTMTRPADSQITTVRTEAELAEALGGAPPAFVPTMGSLHEGHLALIRQAASSGRPVVVSIFVNPTQFDEQKDFDQYPRTLETDLPLAAKAGAAVVFAPAAETVYPPDRETPIPDLPEVALKPGLEDASRPGHFEGVCQVVARLFDMVRPAEAHFGEKDYQQLQVIRALVENERSRWPELTIVPGPTVREPDGLAMSSRNARLKPDERKRAIGLYRALQAARMSRGEPVTAEIVMREALEAHDLDIDYAVVRDAQSLMPIKTLVRPARALVAARIGEVRLIDNAPMSEWA